MALGIHKPGQGYWVRVLTATMLAIATLATAAWVAGQAGVVASKLKPSTWMMEVTLASGSAEPQPGQMVSLVERVDRGEGKEVGTAKVESYDQAAGELRIGSVNMGLEGTDPSAASLVRAASDGGEGKAFLATIRAKSATGIPLVQPILLKGMVGALVLVLGVVLIYWIVGVNVKASEFLIATDMEMKKVNWSTRKDIYGSTMVVIGAAFLIAAFIYGVDWSFSMIFKAIGLLVS